MTIDDLSLAQLLEAVAWYQRGGIADLVDEDLIEIEFTHTIRKASAEPKVDWRKEGF